MQILGKIEAKEKRFSVGGREVLCICFELPMGETPAAKHFLSVIQALCASAEREQMPIVTDALRDAVRLGQGHRFAKRHYRITLGEVAAGDRRRVTVSATLSRHDMRSGTQVLYHRSLETLWDAKGSLQSQTQKRRRARVWRAAFQKPKNANNV